MRTFESKTLTLPARKAGRMEIMFGIAASLTIIMILQHVIEEAFSPAANPPYPTQTNLQVPATLTGFGAQQVADARLQEISKNVTTSSLYSLKPDHQDLWVLGEFDQIYNELLDDASKAASASNDDQLGQTMALLGMTALQQNDADTAQVFLNEALDLFEELEQPLDIANVELLRGMLSVQKREQARRAAYAYDTMQLAGWKIAKGRFFEAIPALQAVISENLKLNRFGAAAFAHETLFKGYQRNGMIAEAQASGIEVVRLHASAGRPLKAQTVLQRLQAQGLDAQTYHQLDSEVLELQQQYEASVKQISQARDYRQLYRHFINVGDPVRAWQFRLKANVSLQGVSKRAMHRRQSGVMAILYNSNDHMRQAQRSLDRALQVFAEYDQDTLSDYSESLKLQIY